MLKQTFHIISSKLHFVLYSLIIASTTVVSLVYQIPFFSLLLAVIVISLFYMVSKPKVWLLTVYVSMVAFVISNGVKFSVIDLFFAIFYFGGLVAWFIWFYLVKRNVLFKSWLDFLLLLFLGLTLVFNSIIATDHGTSLVNWLKEWSFCLMLLYYFPLREYFRSKRDIDLLIYAICLMVLIFFAFNVYTYSSFIKQSEYAYQIYGVRNGEVFIAIGVIIGITKYAYSKHFRGNTFYGAISVIATTAVIMGYNRGLWLVIIVVVLMIIALVQYKERIKLIVHFSINALLIFIVLQVYMGNVGELIGKILLNRFLSSAKGTKDISLSMRVYETNVVLKMVEEEWVSGYGYGTLYSYWNPYSKYAVRYTFIHNGYLSLIMKNGVFIALIFYSILLFFYSKSIYNVYRVRTNIYSKELTEYVLIPFGVMTVLLVSSITAGQFYSREGGLAFSLCFALISIADNGTLMLNTKTITNNDISS
ncbi:MAG: O-antigen ligase family protein [Candidatus Kapaibacterium sp.]|nr:O-antigen ligase family protein [Bacteroidota bacterium]